MVFKFEIRILVRYEDDQKKLLVIFNEIFSHNLSMDYIEFKQIGKIIHIPKKNIHIHVEILDLLVGTMFAHVYTNWQIMNPSMRLSHIIYVMCLCSIFTENTFKNNLPLIVFNTMRIQNIHFPGSTYWTVGSTPST